MFVQSFIFANFLQIFVIRRFYQILSSCNPSCFIMNPSIVCNFNENLFIFVNFKIILFTAFMCSEQSFSLTSTDISFLLNILRHTVYFKPTPPPPPYFLGCKLSRYCIFLIFLRTINRNSLRSCLHLNQSPSIKYHVCLVPPFSMYFTEQERCTGRGRVGYWATRMRSHTLRIRTLIDKFKL